MSIENRQRRVTVGGSRRETVSEYRYAPAASGEAPLENQR